MGLVYAEIELINAEDLGVARRGFMKDGDIRQITVSALVDSGAYMMAIPEEARIQLGLETKEHRAVEYADGRVEELDVVGPMEIRFANRRTVANAVVVGKEVLLGSIPMEDMDVVIQPRARRLVVNPQHPTMPQVKMK